MCDTVGLDAALDELGMLSTATKYKMEFLQSLETKFHERNARQTTKYSSVQLTVTDPRSIQATEEISTQEAVINQMESLSTTCPAISTVRITPAITIEETGINDVQVNSPGLQMDFSNPFRGADIIVDTRNPNYVTNITIHQNQRGNSLYSTLKLDNEMHCHRTQYKARLSVPSSRSHLSSPYLSRIITQLPRPCPYESPTYCPPFRTTLKLNGVLTSFKHRAFRTRSRVRFCNREESTEDLTRQLANIKLDISGFHRDAGGSKSDSECLSGSKDLFDHTDSNRNNTALTYVKPCSKERHPATILRSSEYRSSLNSLDLRSRLILEPRSRHISLESSDQSIHSGLTSSLTRLDLEDTDP